MWALLCLGLLQAKSLEDYVRAVPSDKRADLLDAIERALKAAARTSDAEAPAKELDEEARRHPWSQHLPVLTSSLRGRKGLAADVLLHALTRRTRAAGALRDADYRALLRWAVEAAAPLLESARDGVVDFLGAAAALTYTDDLGQCRSIHDADTRARIRKALSAAAADPRAQAGLRALDEVER